MQGQPGLGDTPIHMYWEPSKALAQEMQSTGDDYEPPQLPSLPISSSDELVEGDGIEMIQEETPGSVVIRHPTRAGKWALRASVLGECGPVLGECGPLLGECGPGTWIGDC